MIIYLVNHAKSRPLITRFDMCVIDLDQTALLLRQALNFTANIAYKGGIVLFVCRQPSLVHMTDRAAQDCGEYSYTRWVEHLEVEVKRFSIPGLGKRKYLQLLT